MKKLPAMMTMVMGGRPKPAMRGGSKPMDSEDEDSEEVPAEGESEDHPDMESPEEDANESPEDESAEEMSIPLPSGFEVPPHARNGETFEVIAKAKVADGRLVFESLDGQGIKPDEEDSDEVAENKLRQAVRQERMA